MAFVLSLFALHLSFFCFVLRFYGPVNPIGSCRAQSVYLTKRLLGRTLLLWCLGKTALRDLIVAFSEGLYLYFIQTINFVPHLSFIWCLG